MITLTDIEVTAPDKLTYKVGETIDYTGLKVIAHYSDGAQHNVTNNCVRWPSEGSIVTNDTEKLIIDYVNEGMETAEQLINLNVITLDSLTITDTNIYKLNDVISYSNVVVTANYSDNTSEDVSDKVTYSLAEGTTASRDTPRQVTVTYEKANGVSITGTLNLKIKVINLLEVTEPTKLSYVKGETIDLSGLYVICHYTDNTSKDVTNLISLNVTNGATVDASTPKTVIITYTESSEVVTYEFALDIAIEEEEN